MGIPDIAAAIAAASEAAKLVQGLLDRPREREAREVAASLLGHILDLQARLAAVQRQDCEQTRALMDAEAKIKEYARWDAEAARYELREIAQGIFVYALKEANCGTEPEHWLCPYCYEARKKSVVMKEAVDRTNYKCHACGFGFIPVAQAGPRYGSGRPIVRMPRI